MSLETLTRELEECLADMLGAHRKLCDLAGSHREALRAADGRAITAMALERDAVNGRITQLSSKRKMIVAELSASLGLATDGPHGELTLSTLLERIGPSRSERLAALADELRSAIESSRREHSVLRDATAAVAGHLSGVMTQIVNAASTARTYTAQGRVAVPNGAVATLDMRH
ncbi:MAG: flagellar export chaperone FlgN [Planctomycetota bacterium]